jgi:hypothetical protein
MVRPSVIVLVLVRSGDNLQVGGITNGLEAFVVGRCGLLHCGEVHRERSLVAVQRDGTTSGQRRREKRKTEAGTESAKPHVKGAPWPPNMLVAAQLTIACCAATPLKRAVNRRWAVLCGMPSLDRSPQFQLPDVTCLMRGAT